MKNSLRREQKCKTNLECNEQIHLGHTEQFTNLNGFDNGTHSAEQHLLQVEPSTHCISLRHYNNQLSHQPTKQITRDNLHAILYFYSQTLFLQWPFSLRFNKIRLCCFLILKLKIQFIFAHIISMSLLSKIKQVPERRFYGSTCFFQSTFSSRTFP